MNVYKDLRDQIAHFSCVQDFLNISTLMVVTCAQTLICHTKRTIKMDNSYKKEKPKSSQDDTYP